jgi:hypothetical protein
VTDCWCRSPHFQALLAVLRGDMDRARGELDLLGDDELEALRRANGDLELELGWVLAERGQR